MFTGIITGDRKRAAPCAAPTADCSSTSRRRGPTWLQGESVAVDGACLTVTAIGPAAFTVHVIATSLERTAFGRYVAGRRVNLERALRLGDRLGGHLVQGHVDGVGTVSAVAEADDGRLLTIEVPRAVARVSIPLGSITVDGVSLTINAVSRPGAIQVSLIPFTLQHTTLGERTSRRRGASGGGHDRQVCAQLAAPGAVVP